MSTLTITPKAESDLVEVWVYTCEKWSAEQADKYLDQLEVGMKQLLEHPELGINYEHARAGYRKLQVEQHAVFYQVQGKNVLVVRVLHEEMDAPLRLF